LIGPGGLTVPHAAISSHVGDVNEKTELTLTDGLDFWESLEAMRIRVARPVVLGFRGGREKFDSPKRYLSLFVRPEASGPDEHLTAANGLLHAPELGDFNPEIIRISTNVLSPKVDAQMSFNVGDQFAEDLIGIMSFQTNTFGDGEFTMFVTGEFASTSSIKSLEERPSSRLIGDADHLTVATWNVENLSARADKKMKRIGSAIKNSLKCPDVINLAEIQDNNGSDSRGDSAADQTLQAVIAAIDCPGANYQPINIDPMPNADGGEPGGNIRVAMLYNANRVAFTRRAQAGSLDETLVVPGIGLSQNPGRLFPNAAEFISTRKPLVAQFSFKGQNFFVVGIHLNSRLSDQSSWSKDQPVAFSSELDRIKLATKINGFISDLIKADPMAKILVVGDTNAYWHERSMQILAGDALQNLMTYGNLVAKNQRYSTNFEGSSSCIDHVLASRSMLNQSPELEIVHITSDFMDKLSDHDPVVARFQF
jgi:predicted extracellular nuclease